ncbi:GbsR/MarR family transcriptional regulator [Pseudonocardia sp. TRM90224]|uniref:GbsR/MarR family transcriptional regulator n=1 Tax=Pseudonocardia sp. TRM90224 TaxID=2812678 RepID=UPI001E303A33|nr:MarR family transcriptional regulator [Pseudonocardia sp. TRM90224]
MTEPSELAFADEAGRYFARQHGLPPMTGRVIGWLMLCEPQLQTIAELAEALRASRTAVTSAVAVLESWEWVQRSRAAGERVDRVGLSPGVWMRQLDNPAEYTAFGALAQRGLDALADAPSDRRARLVEMAAFAEFLAERMPALGAEWMARRDALRAHHEEDR